MPERPISAAVPVRVSDGWWMWRRAIGRTTRKRSAVMTTNAKIDGIAPAPARLNSAATKAPPANGARKKPMIAISPTANATPAIVHQTHMSISNQTNRDNGGVRLAAHLSGSAPSGQEGSREVLRVEGAQVLERFADPDQLDGDPQLAGDRKRDAALRGAVELGQNDAVDGHRLGEELGLAHPVLPRRRVDRQQRLVRGVGHLALDHAPDLGQLGHQLVLGVQAPRRVDDHDVDAELAAALDRVERDGAGI